MSSRRNEKAAAQSVSKPSSSTKAIKDSRFAGIQNDPRYRLPSKRKLQTKVDKRFSGMLKDDDFVHKAKVDRYGRPLEGDSERNRLKRKYQFDEDGEVKPDDDDEVQAELMRVEKKFDPIRDGGYSSSSDESSSDEEEDEKVDDLDQAAQAIGVPMGEATSRIAVVNLDWDHIRAEDLMAVFSSFLPQGGRIEKVVVYPSEFGKERMEREEIEGPPRELFKAGTADGESEEESLSDDEDDEAIKQSLIQPDTGEEVDSNKLRRYQLERLRYFYAVLKFSSIQVAQAVYEAVDGTEYLSTANFFDLRFIPDDTDFSSDKPRDECERLPETYKPNEFVTDALQHSKVKLTWDADDNTRKEAQAKAFRGGRKEIDENDLKAYLGSDSSDTEAEIVDPASSPQADSKSSKKEKEKQRLRALLGLSEPSAKASRLDVPVGGVQVTFSSGLSGNDKKPSVFANDPEPDETTAEKYVRKERERKQRRREKHKGTHEGADEDNGADKDQERPASEDLGFDDPFFTEPLNDKASAAALRKAERKKKREEREQEEEANAVKRAELELLMVDDKAANVRHFDMNEIERAEKKRNKKKKGKKDNMGEDAVGEVAETDDTFKMDVADPRFARLFENHEFAIDPTNSKFKGTSGMKALLEEGRKRRKIEDVEDVPRKEKVRNSKQKQPEGGNEDLNKLIQKVKTRSK